MSENESSKVFQIQVPQQLIRNKNFSDSAFVMYAKLIQIYYLTGRESVIPVDHRMIMYQLNIRDNKRFKRIMDELYKKKLIKTKLGALPRKGYMEIEINTFFDLKKQNKDKEDRFFYAQLPYHVLEYPVLNAIGVTGVRLLYYYESYINRKQGKEFAYPSYETIMEETGLADKTLTKYNNILVKHKFIKIIKHQLQCTYEYIKKDTGEILNYIRHNNHYYVYPERIIKYHNKIRDKQNKEDDE